MARIVLRLGWLVFAFVVLASCSGGGGGGGGGDNPRLNVSPTSFTFTATQNGATPAAQEASVSISGGSVAVGIQSNSASSFVSASFTITGNTTGKITLAPLSPSFVTPGTHTGTVVVRGCLDPICSSGDADGSPVSINVSYTVQPQTGLRASPQSLSFTQLKGATPPAQQTLGLSDRANASYAWTASIVYQQATTGWLNINNGATASAASLPSTLSVSINPTTTVGTLTALIRFTGNGSTLDVPVSYTVNEPTLTRSPAQMTFTAAATGALPSTQTVTLTTQSGLPVDYTTSVAYSAGATNWLNVVPATGTAPRSVIVGVNTTALAIGTYTATLTFTTATQMLSVSVTYTVSTASITFSPGSAFFQVTPTSDATALSNTVSVGSTGAAISWTASSSQPWVTVTPSGTTPSTVTLSLNRTALETVDPGTQTATITFSYTAPGASSPTSTPLSVTFNNLLPKATSVSPYVAISGTSRELVLRGAGFNLSGSPAIKFGTAGSATTYTVVSDTEIRVTHPSSLAVGTYQVSFANQLGAPNVVRSTANLVVVDAPVYAAKSLAYPDTGRTVKRIAYDAERQALLVGVTFPATGDTIGAVYRYTFNVSDWSATPASSPNIGGLHDFAPQPDGKNLIVVSETAVTPFDAVTLLAAGTPTSVDLGHPDFFLNKIGMANDGNAIIIEGIRGSGFMDAFRYSVADATITKVGFSAFFGAGIGASANGSRIVAVSTLSAPVYEYNASAGTLSQTSLTSTDGNPDPALDRNATRILLGGRTVYDSNYVLKGAIPFAGTAVSLSPDGNKAYTREVTVGGSSIVHVYDLTAQTSGGFFPEIGTGTATPSNPGSAFTTRMAISPDGGTLFIAGETGIVVMPAPQ